MNFDATNAKSLWNYFFHRHVNELTDDIHWFESNEIFWQFSWKNA